MDFYFQRSLMAIYWDQDLEQHRALEKMTLVRPFLNSSTRQLFVRVLLAAAIDWASAVCGLCGDIVLKCHAASRAIAAAFIKSVCDVERFL